MLILNLTMHEASPEQMEAGVLPLHETDRGHRGHRGHRDHVQPFTRLKELLTFEDIPTQYEVIERAEQIAALAEYSALADHSTYLQFGGYEYPDVTAAMIGGAPFLMEPLAVALRARGLDPVYAFSRRESEEVVQPDGSTKKVAVFRHLGFVGAD